MTEPNATTGFPAIVVQIISDRTVVINRGEADGVQKGQRFLVYHVDPEPIVDPETGEDLGRLEVVRGTGTATHVQDRLTTVSSDRKAPTERRVVKKRSLIAYLGEELETVTGPGETRPFDYPRKGDKVKPI